MNTSAASVLGLTDTSSIRLHGSLAVQSGTPMFMAFARAEDVVTHAHVDVFDPKTGNGYQRVPTTSRQRQAADYYRKGGRMPNPLLVNIREADFDKVKVEVTSGSLADYRAAIEEDGSFIGAGYIEVPPELALWIYDGQHREGGLRDLLEAESA